MPRTYATIELDVQQDWVTVWLNRPDSRNALSSTMIEELSDAVAGIADERSIRGVTLRGRGGVFCAGGDLKGFQSVFQGGADAESVRRANREFGALFERINAAPQVVVVLVEGAAMAGGFGMVCCADVVVVRADAQFALTETMLGIPPAQIAPFVVQRLGLPLARRLMLTATRFDGTAALALGLADFVAADTGQLDDIERGIRRQVQKCAPGANAVTKEILLATRSLERDALLELAAQRFAECMLGAEGREGIAAFVEKRQPAWAAAAGKTPE